LVQGRCESTHVTGAALDRHGALPHSGCPRAGSARVRG
jgi:hypothetical protein